MTDLKSALELRTLEANAHIAELAAQRAAVEFNEWNGVVAQSQRGAALAKPFAPDLSALAKHGRTSLPEGQPLASTGLALAGLKKASEEVAKRVQAAIAESTKIDKGVAQLLITTDADLVTSDLMWVQVDRGIARLCDAIKLAVSELGGPSPNDEVTAKTQDNTDTEVRTIAPQSAGGLGAALSVAASLAPAVLSLASAQRSLATSTFNSDASAASALVADNLNRNHTVSIDEFRLVSETAADLDAPLHMHRGKLANMHVALAVEHTLIEKDDAEAKERETHLGRRLEEALEEQKPEIEERLEEIARARIDLKQQLAESATRVGAVTALMKSADDFLAAIHTVPDGAQRSPFAWAALRHGLHPTSHTEDLPDSFILLVQAGGGSIDQLVQDRPLWLKDTVHSIATASITYLLLVVDEAKNSIRASGVAIGQAEMKGKIGDSLETPASRSL